jgi:hypothetical protein
VFIFTHAADGVRQQTNILDYVPGEDAIDIGGATVDLHYSFAGATYLVLNGADYDSLVVSGAASLEDIQFI